MNTPTVATAQQIQVIVDLLEHKPGALLPILHELQNTFDYIPPIAIAIIAKSLRQTSAEIHGVISFYRHFHTEKNARHRLEICRAEACQARGARTLERHAKKTLAVDYHQSTADRNITLDPVYCLGNCSCGPNIRVGNDIIGRVDNDKFDRIVENLATQGVQIQ
ncbi:MAG: formate dehydrogenase subunit gamma [Oceanospirillaceae bacterium]|nr:formate dehydrogenase subunit gamma [Oceanospirillaceae bacterium]